MENEKKCCCSDKTTIRSEEQKKALLNRLKRIEGQVRGIQSMLENDAYCNDVLMQSAAVNAAMNAFNKELLANHIRNCVVRDIREGDELVQVLTTNGSEKLLVVTRHGMAVRYDENDVRPMGRTAAGVRAIKLREGVTFHNGKEFGSEDVVASMNRWLTVNDRAASLLPGATFAASGDHEVTCTLTEPAVDFLIILGNHSQYPGIFPSEVIEAAGYEPEHDLDNPADSVFCAHGAGFVVPWEQVRSHMHVDSGWGKTAKTEEAVQARPRRMAAYRATLEEDAELLKIFEQTYGPIKRDPLAAFRPTQKRERPDFNAEQWEIQPEYLLVDGYNIIFAWDELNALSKESLEAARHRLMDILCNYQGFKKCVLILVFDAYRVPGSPGSIEQYHNIHVVYTREAETADMFIERVTHEIGKDRRVRVATSDGMEQVIILGHGALRVSARMFHEEVQEAEKEIRRYLQGTD